MIGVPEEHFWDSTPAELQPYVKMDELAQKRKDAEMWQMGLYVNNAVYVAVERALMGRKSHSEYVSEPFLQMQGAEEKNSNKTDFAKFSAWATVYNEKQKDKGPG